LSKKYLRSILMNKLKIVMSGIALAAMVLLMLTGCPQEADSQNSDAVLAEIKVGTFAADKIPTPITKAQWDGTEYLDDYISPDYTATVMVTQTSDLLNAQIAVKASAGAKIKYGDASSSMKPEAGFDTSSIRNLVNNGILYIQVTSEDGKKVVYYRIQIKAMNSVSTLNLIKVAGVNATLGTPGAAWDAAGLVPGTVGISNSQKNNAIVEVTKTAQAASVKFAKASGTGTPGFGTTDTFTFADGDFLYVEVTAENGIARSVYKVEVQIGRTATVTAIQIGQRAVSSLGEPAGTVTGITTPGTILMNQEQPPGGYVVAAVPSDPDATVKYGAASGAAQPSFDTNTTIQLTDGGYLYVEVTAANGTTRLYYKIQVNLPMSGIIKYGSPEIKASSEKYVDALWNDVTLDTYNIVKIYPGDSAGYPSPPATTGVAKALWDETGLYVYVDVTDPTVDTAVPGAADHTSDSVELFINEDGNTERVNNTGSYVGRGGQYRVGAHGEKSGDAPAQTLASGWPKDDNSGYVVIFRAPWRYKNNFPLEGGKKIGFELQINACTQNGAREAVIVWNNIAHTNYQNVTDFGVATLDLNGHTLTVNAKDPLITAHPSGNIYTSTGGTASALTVTAASRDGGTITYQWYSNTVNNYTNGMPIDGQTNASYTPDISAEGTSYYWVSVTNTITDNGDGGIKSAILPSGIASILVSSVPLVEKIEAGASSLPVYQFTPSGGSTWSDYKTITFTVMVADQTSYDESATRAYIGGSYQASTFGPSGTFTKLSGWNDARLVKITDGAVLKTLIDDPGLNIWKTVSYPIVMDDIPAGQKDASYATATYYPAAAATGPFYFALGFSVNPNNGSGRTVTYYIKDVALVKADGTTKLLADSLMGTTSAGASVGQLKCIFSNDSGAKVIRTLEAEPATP
jgi:hypothetical protein